jgi:high affinity Mn2+ porin
MPTKPQPTHAVLVQLRHLLLAACSLSGLAQAVEQQDQAAWFQSTYNWQKHPAFGAAYASKNSLSALAEHMYTFSATAMVGFRPWQGAEAYADGEVVQGIPFSGALIGMGSYTNGEITRAAGSSPQFYRQRLYLRQTWNQGGESQAVASDLNQLAGSVDSRRFVVTLGNFSTLDLFDGNTYAKDPRTQFMNWAHWTYAAYDYAADARGFGWGLAGEWYRDDWVLRLARMSGPTQPNLASVDLALARHHGDQVEVEHSHQWLGRPGRVRLLGWRNRAVLASFRDATQYLLTHPGSDPQAIFQVRQGERIKYGLGLNIEQEFSDSVGGFLRLMKADGRTETQAFTEVDSSLSAGVLVKGLAWRRAADSLGLALAWNALSNDRRQYLAAGGLSYFIGDGALRYRPETLLETYYSLATSANSRLTLDWQHVVNPAYNADRGPVNVVAVRLHTQF